MIGTIVDQNLLNNTTFEQFEAQVTTGYQIGYDLAFSYIGYFVYLPVIAIVIYAILMKIPERFDRPIIKGDGLFKRMTWLQASRKITLAISIAAAGWLALMFFTDGAVVHLTF